MINVGSRARSVLHLNFPPATAPLYPSSDYLRGVRGERANYLILEVRGHQKIDKTPEGQSPGSDKDLASRPRRRYLSRFYYLGSSVDSVNSGFDKALTPLSSAPASGRGHDIR